MQCEPVNRVYRDIGHTISHARGHPDPLTAVCGLVELPCSELRRFILPDLGLVRLDLRSDSGQRSPLSFVLPRPTAGLTHLRCVFDSPARPAVPAPVGWGAPNPFPVGYHCPLYIESPTPLGPVGGGDPVPSRGVRGMRARGTDRTVCLVAFTAINTTTSTPELSIHTHERELQV